MQWPKDTKGITRSRISKKDSQYNGQKIPMAEPEAVYQRTVNAMAKRYQRHNQKPYIKEGQSIQWPKDTEGITRSRISKDSQYNSQKIPKA